MPNRIEISAKRRVYGWSAMVDFIINDVGGFTDFGEAKASLLWSRELILTLEPRKIRPVLAGAGAKGFRLTIEAADTAAAAEALGLKLADAILSVAIERSWGVSLSWPDQPLPCRVVDRNASKGPSAFGFGSVTSHTDANSFVEAIDTAFQVDSPYRVLLSKELCASSRFQNDSRAKLIMLVSAFEALVEQRDLTDEVGALIEHLQFEIENSAISDSLKPSLFGQIRNMRRESVRRSLERFMTENKIMQSDRDLVDEAYLARSKVVHEGQRVPELDIMTGKLDVILRNIYATLAGTS